MAKRRAGAELTHDNWDHEDDPEEAGIFSVADKSTLSKRPMVKARRRVTGQQKEEGPPTQTPFSAFKGFTGFGATSFGSTNTAASFGSTKAAASFSFKPLSSTKSPDSQATTTTTAQNTLMFGSSQSIKSGQDSKPIVSFKDMTDTKPSSAMFKLTNTGAGVTLSSNGSTTAAADKENNSKGSDIYANELRSLNQSVSAWIQKHVESNPVCDLSPIFEDYKKHLSEIEKKRGEGKEEQSVAESKVKPQLATVSPLTSTQDKSSSNSTSSFTGFKFSSTAPPTSAENPSGSSTSTKAGFSFGSSSADNKGFSFGTTKASSITAPMTAGAPFSFGGVKPAASAEDQKKSVTEEAESDEPPKEEAKIVEEKDAVYSNRCKVFYKQGSDFKDRGVGMLYLKKSGSSGQIIVRADTSLGTIILNIGVSEDLVKRITKQGKNKNNLMLMSPLNPPMGKKCPKCDKLYTNPQETTACESGCSPDPLPLLLRVKREADADELLEEIKKLFE